LGEKALAGNLSRGQRAGLCLALTLAPEPELLILDDPSLGLDPVARHSLLESMIYVTRREDRTILFSSHLLSDVERVADEIAIMDHGVLRAHCSVEDFRDRVRQLLLKFKDAPPPVGHLPGLLHSFRTDNSLLMSLVNIDADTEAALNALQPESMEEVPLTLEEAFVAYVRERGEKSFFLHEMENKK
jgi:ABC-2 type transport system ATP-binding protein